MASPLKKQIAGVTGKLMLFETKHLVSRHYDSYYLGIGKAVVLTGQVNPGTIFHHLRDTHYSLVTECCHLDDLRSVLLDLYNNLYVGSLVSIQRKNLSNPLVSEFIEALSNREVIEATDGNCETLSTGLYMDLPWYKAETIMQSISFYFVRKQGRLLSTLQLLRSADPDYVRAFSWTRI